MNKKNLFSCILDMPYGRTTPYQLFDAAKNSREFVQKLQLQRKIPVHDGCVNSICWNDTGKYLLSGSDDQHLSIVRGNDYTVLAYILTGHRANIFSAKFLPNTGDSHVVSCSGDGIIVFSDLERPLTSLNNKFNCHRGTAYEIMTVPNDPNTFLSCGEDRSVRWFDLRTKTSCSKEDCKDDILINCQSPVTSLAVNPLTPYQLAVGCADASVRIFDRRMLSTQNASGFCASNGFQALMSCFTVPEFTQSRRITSLCYSGDGQEMLVSYSSDYIYLFDIRDDLEKKPRFLSAEGCSSDSNNDSGLFFRGRPLMKRLRIRGDWSDTGPNARPEAESRDSEEATSSRSSIVRTMTNILTRMLNTSQARTRSEASHSSSASSHASSQSEDGDGEAVSDSIDEDADHAMEGASGSNESNPDVPSKRKEKPEKGSDPSNQSPVAKNKCIKKTDINQPSTSSAFVEDKPTNDSYGATSEPSTSTHTEDILDNVNKSEPSASDSNVNNVNEEQILCDMSNDSDFESIEKKLESRRKDLIEKHNTEPMVNLHYSGQSVSSGQITMDVANSSVAGERQWIEQSLSDLPELPTDISNQEQPNETSDPPPETSQTNEAQPDHASSESDTEAGMQSIQPNQNLLPIISNIRSLAHSSSSSAQAESSGEVDDGEMELMMEVDSWDVDSDDESRQSSRASGSRRRSIDRISSRFMDSLNSEVKAANEELRKVEAHMSFVTQPRVKKKFTGHRNARTMIKESTFWGDNFIMSGSDCGHIFIWDRHTTELVMLMEADHHVVNCLQPHPFDPILASSGIDYDIKLWAPTREEPFFDEEKAGELIRRNEIMLEETKDTITVPASFMFRMFTSLNYMRTGRAYRWNRAAREMRSANSDSNRR
ncbi:DDB1- and CUL4-associated factor 6-like isoform X2 [Argiope bruennichi]|uniref:DDB1- and CUL4-associated factor 6-like isoform X2 n=1 Tax=Argiope bruennichi TaxID=94029 RepID=UPI0024959204|nr:DDB1- and CUL4-associated factor 6-like isoform X2 [Argiope bruennichi]